MKNNPFKVFTKYFKDDSTDTWTETAIGINIIDIVEMEIFVSHRINIAENNELVFITMECGKCHIIEYRFSTLFTQWQKSVTLLEQMVYFQN